jgi:hypothetical protein
MKFVKALTDSQKKELTRIYKGGACHQSRQRAHAILLSDRFFCLNKLSDIFSVDRDTISVWIDHWHAFEYDGLTDEPKSGAPKKLNDLEEKEALALILETPRQTKLAIEKIKDRFNKTVSKDWIKRLLKKKNTAGNAFASHLKTSAKS